MSGRGDRARARRRAPGRTGRDGRERPGALGPARRARLARVPRRPLHAARAARGGRDGRAYIAMELVVGTSLRAWLDTPRTIPEITRAFAAAGRGLAAAHAAGIVHRDFKPDNCLVGADGRVRVTDFGLAAARAEAATIGRGPGAPVADVALTAAGTVLGTPAYMAPEQLVGGNVDSRSDQFSFCVALYEALYGQRPFAGKTFEELADNVCDGALLPPPTSSRVSRALRAIVVRGLAVRPGDRFATMDALLVELSRDRARAWRRTAIVAAILGGVLALGLVVDLVMRARMSATIAQAFTATGRQVDRAFGLLADRFDTSANLIYNLAVMRDVAGHRDDSDFGLGEHAQDETDLATIHETLRSQDWTLVRQFGRKQAPSILAVADKKGRLLFTSADGDRWQQDLLGLPWIKRALERGTPNGLALVRADDPALVASGLLGPVPPTGLVFVFTRALVLNHEVTSVLVQILPAASQIDAIRIDDDTRISLAVADPSGRRAIGDVPVELALALAGPGEAGVVERRAGGVTYDVQVLPMTYADEVIGQVVLARAKTEGLSLFPGARATFAALLIVALLVALGTARRAHELTHARA
ncbi:MAG: serine/threonine-protein kinase [Proteobacteria bacterium]|nr:serine/threonine-protein kinase [Pseudomonadota bacterium]